LRYRELSIETQRQAPSNARTAGFAWLNRAGYLTRLGEPTRLGQQSIARLKESSRTSDFLARLAIPVIRGEEGEVFFAVPTGSAEVLQCPACNYAARREIARFKKQIFSTEEPLPPEKVATPGCNTIESLATFLGIPKERTAKALMFTRPADGKFVFVVMRGDLQLSQSKLVKRVGPVRPATAEEIAAVGAAPGYASPIGLKDALVAVDDLIPGSPNLAAGANESGYHLKNVNYGRDYRAEIVADLALAGAGDTCPNCTGGLKSVDAEMLADGSGYDFNAILTAMAEVHHDDAGLTLPAAAAPFDVYLMNLPGKELDTDASAEELYADLQREGISVLYDDRDERAGVKFNDADLIGPPLRVTVGEKNLRAGMVELKPRQAVQNQPVAIVEILPQIRNILGKATG
jgi:prolyl-tRNA synthetase